MTRIGLLIQTRIKSRTLAGRDVDGKPFKGYSPGHAKRRQKLGLPTDKVDLFFTGSMQSAMTFEADEDQVRLYFAGTADKFGGSNPEKAFFLHQDRKFFALSDEDIRVIEEEVDTYIRQSIR